MSNEEITALAREYAEESTKADASDPNLSESDLIEIRHDIEEYVTGILRFLFRRYALVEKSKVEELYDHIRQQQRELWQKRPQDKDVENARKLLLSSYAMERDMLESLFPEIAKEVER